MTELVPAFATIAMMVFTYNIANGLTAGLALYPFVKAGGRPGPRGAAGGLGARRAVPDVLPVRPAALSPGAATRPPRRLCGYASVLAPASDFAEACSVRPEVPCRAIRGDKDP